MNINRNNYEEYFLLYADNELMDSEKAEVLMFLKDNRDLEEEFRMIHNTICKPDASIELADKSFLFRNNAAPFINEKNYEEVFILYHDNELTENEKQETETFLFNNAQLRNEFELIGMARLTPEDSVIFPGKKYLYKKEKTGKVVPVIFWRMLAAAVFIGFGLWITIFYFQKPTEKFVATEQSVPAKKASPLTKKNTLLEKEPVNTIVHSTNKNAPSSATGINHEKEKLQKLLVQKNNNSIAAVKSSIKTKKRNQENIAKQLPEKRNNETIAANQEIKNMSKKEITTINTIEPSSKESLRTQELAQNIIKNKNVKVEPAMHAQTASYIADAKDNNENYVFYDITTEEFKKTKMGGFLKKVKRVIERNNPISRLLSGDDRQVVSN